jgi:hypothetical protein
MKINAIVGIALCCGIVSPSCSVDSDEELEPRAAVDPATGSPYAFKVLIDVNLLNANDATNILMLSAADGMWGANLPPYGGPTIDWTYVIDSLAGNSKWLVTEDVYNFLLKGSPSSYATATSLGRTPNEAMVYYETYLTSASGPVYGTGENDSILLSKTDANGNQVYIHAPDGTAVAAPNQIGKASTLVGGLPVIVNSRSYVPTDSRYYYTNAALSNRANGGVSFELNQSFPFDLNIAAGLSYCLDLGKPCYLLLSYDVTQANAQFPNYLSLVQQMLAYLEPYGILSNPNFYLVLPVYGSAIQTSTTFIQNPALGFINPANISDPDTMLGALSWVKAAYPTGSPGGPPVSPAITGNIDGVTANSDGTATVSGWACALYDPNPVDVDLYLGNKFISRTLANQASERAVARACSGTGSTYRFSIPLSASFVAGHAGANVLVYGISPWGLDNNALDGAGAFKIP